MSDQQTTDKEGWKAGGPETRRRSKAGLVRCLGAMSISLKGVEMYISWLEQVEAVVVIRGCGCRSNFAEGKGAN